MSDRVLELLGRPEVWAIVVGLAGFLVLTWLIRQAPLGQAGRVEPGDGPSPAERDRAAILVVLGFMLAALGGFIVVRYSVPASIPAFAAGIGLILWVLNRHRAQRHSSPTIRRLVAFAETGLTASLLGGILLVGNTLAFRFGGRPLDLTHDQAFSLSSLTLNQLDSLDRPLILTVFFGDSERSRRQLDRVRQLVDLYHTANPGKVQVVYLNPFADVTKFEALARRVPDVLAAGGDGLVLDYGDQADAPRAVLGMRELFDLSANTGSASDRFVSTFRGEDAITAALMRLREGKRWRIAFTTGHSEPSTAEVDASRSGFGLWKARLDSVGSEVLDVNLLRDDVPEGVSLLVIGGPKAPFQDTEIERVKQFIARGGTLLVLASSSEPTGLENLLAIYNVRLEAGVAADSRFTFKNWPTIIYAPIAANMVHPITGSLAGRPVLVQDAAPIVILGTGAASKLTSKVAVNPGIITTPILRTSPDSWVESDSRSRPITFDRKQEQPGPVIIGVAATTRPALAAEPPVPRMVCFSAPSLADNRLLWNEPTNIDLLMNSISWLRGKPEGSGIAPKIHESLAFAADPGLQLRLVLVPTLAALVVILGLGLSTYLARRD